MKKYNVQLAVLVLFSAVFASGVASAMEKELKELPELEPKILGEGPVPTLPPDVKKIIATKALRVILDEAEDNPAMLMEIDRERLLRITNELADNPTIWSVFFGMSPEKNIRPIDTVILLIENGANPNTKNYMGSTVFILLMKYYINNLKKSTLDHSSFKNKVDTLELKLKLLVRLKVNVNEIVKLHSFLFEDASLGLTTAELDSDASVGHMMLTDILTFADLVSSRRIKETYDVKENVKRAWSFIFFLKDLGVDFTTIKDADGDSACEVGQKYSEVTDIGEYSKKQLNILCSPPSKSWSFFK